MARLAARARKPPNSGEREGFQVASVTAGGMLVRTVRKPESLLNVDIGKRFLETDFSHLVLFFIRQLGNVTSLLECR